MNVRHSVDITPLFFALLVEIKVSSLHSSVQRAMNWDGGYDFERNIGCGH